MNLTRTEFLFLHCYARILHTRRFMLKGEQVKAKYTAGPLILHILRAEQMSVQTRDDMICTSMQNLDKLRVALRDGLGWGNGGGRNDDREGRLEDGGDGADWTCRAESVPEVIRFS